MSPGHHNCVTPDKIQPHNISGALFAQIHSELSKSMNILLFTLFSLSLVKETFKNSSNCHYFYHQSICLKSMVINKTSIFLMLAFDLTNISHGLILRRPMSNLDAYRFPLLESQQLGFLNSFPGEILTLSWYSFLPLQTNFQKTSQQC